MINRLRSGVLLLLLAGLSLSVLMNAVAQSDMLYENARNSIVSMLHGTAETP